MLVKTKIEIGPKIKPVKQNQCRACSTLPIAIPNELCIVRRNILFVPNSLDIQH